MSVPKNEPKALECGDPPPVNRSAHRCRNFNYSCAMVLPQEVWQAEVWTGYSSI